jgi:hypothetical protein
MDLVGIGAAGQRGGGHAIADLDALDGVDRHHRGGEVGVELAVDRRAEACGHAARGDLDHRADAVAGFAQAVEIVGPVFAALGSGVQNGLRSISSQSKRARSMPWGPSEPCSR